MAKEENEKVEKCLAKVIYEGVVVVVIIIVVIVVVVMHRPLVCSIARKNGGLPGGTSPGLPRPS